MTVLKRIGYHISLITIYFANSARSIISRVQNRDISGARVILIRHQQVLLVNHYHAPWIWTLPGGGIEINEAPEAAAIREVKEETGLNIISMQKIGSFLNIRKGETHVFYSTHFEGAVSPTVRFEIMECKWFPLQHLPQEFFDVDRGHVENYLKIVNSSN